MKALVLCGGIPQIALVKELKSRGITTILADMNEKAPAVKYADQFFPVSVLDVEAVKALAVSEKVDFLITVCADQVLEVVAKVAEELNMPWYIDNTTAENVSKKSYMKKIFVENGVPTSKHIILDKFDEKAIADLSFPIIVKPVDAYSSRGVRRVDNMEELKEAFDEAIEISRGKNAVVEEFVEGDELSVDVYIENGVAKVLCVCALKKIGEDGKFVIHRGIYPPPVPAVVLDKINDAAQKIATAFKLENSPMLIQLINNGENISVVEFCARTGGGVKYSYIKRVTGFDVVKAVVDLTLGNKPHYDGNKNKTFIVNEFLYCYEGELDRVEGLEELLNEGIITEYNILKAPGYKFGPIKSSGDRVAFYTVETDSYEETAKNCLIASQRVKVISKDGKDILRHDLTEKRIIDEQ